MANQADADANPASDGQPAQASPAASVPAAGDTAAGEASPSRWQRRARRRQAGGKKRARPLTMTRVAAVPAVGLLLMLGGGPAFQHEDEAAASAPAEQQPVRGTDYPMPPLTGVDVFDLASSAPTSTDDLATAAADPVGGGIVQLTGAYKQIPDRVLAAYKRATETMATELPGCNLRWQLLAAIGKVESGNASGRSITEDGTVTPRIVGIPLDGRSGIALIRDTDDGVWDGDTSYDRAVGPMQFIPSTWKTSGRDGNADGTKNPNNIHDAALAAGGYLCARGRDLSDSAQLRAAIFSYNPSDSYVRAVLSWMAGYSESDPDEVPIPIVPLGAADTVPVSGGSTPVPTLTLEASGSSPTPNVSPTISPSSSCPTITVTAASLAATITGDAGQPVLDITGAYTPANATATGNVVIHGEARESGASVVLAESDVTVPAQPGDGAAVPLAHLDLSDVTTGTVTVSLTTTPAGCAARTLVTLVVTNIPASEPSPLPTASLTPSASPTPSPSPSATPPPSASPTASPTPARTTTPPPTSAAPTSPPPTSPAPTTAAPTSASPGAAATSTTAVPTSASPTAG
ncbi:lytic transglycosylase domain-containing protein [Frankia nepalensis]|uniref:Lytic transglycosylase domain-containing protein n=1 Tax=Frankia nepalensis TaxID=1836974 RepID=A0A937RAY4_9ACTN|nr:lytic transglycosylase domain-containing protein [Frankia nepalensis]MBL7626412.1 lytic transglycosylase domain-containing protein [Frankia nepalensis]